MKLKNSYHLDGDTAILKTNKGDVFVDATDLPLLERYNKWCVSKRGDVETHRSVGSRGCAKVTAYKLHRVLMNCPSGLEVDHINHNPRDNRRANLRVCTHRENGRNLSIKVNNTSGVAGVSWDKDRSRWKARIKVDYRELYLGRYRSRREAIAARRDAEAKYFREFANATAS